VAEADKGNEGIVTLEEVLGKEKSVGTGAVVLEINAVVRVELVPEPSTAGVEIESCGCGVAEGWDCGESNVIIAPLSPLETSPLVEVSISEPDGPGKFEDNVELVPSYAVPGLGTPCGQVSRCEKEEKCSRKGMLICCFTHRQSR
jgi:hypothetical protein